MNPSFFIGLLSGVIIVGFFYSKAKIKIAELQKELKSHNQSSSLLSKELKLFATQILEENSNKLIENNKGELDKIIAPFKENITNLHQNIKEYYGNEYKEKLSLKHEIQRVLELNNKLSNDAQNLTKALKGDKKMQGNWGEEILINILELSGLEKGVQYTTQTKGLNIEGDIIQPDIIINLPDKKHVIIDAKISLNDYKLYMSVEEEREKEVYLNKHINAIKNQINNLAGKSYSSIKDYNSLDFVLMFIPIEPAYLVAIQEDHSLFENALKKKILIVSPTTLHSTLKIIVALWKQANQTDNVIKIAKLSGSIYDKFVGFITDMNKIKKSLNDANKSHEFAMGKLNQGKGNLFNKFEDMKKLGAKTSKSLEEINQIEE